MPDKPNYFSKYAQYPSDILDRAKSDAYKRNNYSSTPTNYDYSDGNTDATSSLTSKSNVGFDSKENQSYTSKSDNKSQVSLDDAIKRYKMDPGPHNMTVALNKAKPVINSALTSYGGGRSPNLHSEAKKLAVKAIKSYDPDKKVPVKNWLMQNLRGLQRLSGQAEPLRLPERARIDASKVRKAAEDFRQTMARDATYDELADITQLNKKRVAQAMQVSKGYKSEGELTSVTDSEDSADVYLPGTDENGWMNTWAEYVYRDLDPVNQRIFDMLSGRNGYNKRSTNEVAKEVGISPAAVSQRSKQISSRIEEGLRFGSR